MLIYPNRREIGKLQQFHCYRPLHLYSSCQPSSSYYGLGYIQHLVSNMDTIDNVSFENGVEVFLILYLCFSSVPQLEEPHHKPSLRLEQVLCHQQQSADCRSTVDHRITVDRHQQAFLQSVNAPCRLRRPTSDQHYQSTLHQTTTRQSNFFSFFSLRIRQEVGTIFIF